GVTEISDLTNIPLKGTEVVIYITEFRIKLTITLNLKVKTDISEGDYYEIVPHYYFRDEVYFDDYTPTTVNEKGVGNFIKTPVTEPSTGYSLPKIDVNDMPPDWITEDDYRYAMDIIKLSLPNSLAVQEDADMMPNFEGDYVNYGDNVLVGDSETLSYTEDELSKVERKPCKPKINWFFYFLLGVLMSEDETIDLAWVIGHFILCPIQTFINLYTFMPIKNALYALSIMFGWMPLIGTAIRKLADLFPYLYLVEEGMYLIANKKAETVCRKLVLAKKYSCIMFSEEYFMRGKENNWIAKQIVTEISSEEVDALRAAPAYEHLVSDDRQKSIALSSLVYNRRYLFKGHVYPEPEMINEAIDDIREYASVSFDLFMVIGTTLTSNFISAYRTNDEHKIDIALRKIADRLKDVFNMDVKSDISYVVNSIENFRMNTNEYFIYDRTRFPGEYYEKTDK
uniref:hypothetical protein n=1 Tax=Mesotoga prima TaxID=1184387 RepID=UPI002FDB12EB